MRTLARAPKPGTWEAIGPERANITAQLRALPEPQLVLVRYKPNHDPLLEWVYNDARIDAAKVVWARDMTPSQNEELIEYYKDRRVRLLEADPVPPKLCPYVLGNRGSTALLAVQAPGQTHLSNEMKTEVTCP